MTNIILCGGSGTRLWPLSRTLMPKQFVKFFDNKSLFELTVDRNDKLCKDKLIVSNTEQYFLALDQLQKDSKFILEPIGRNTAPAIALACMALEKDEVVLVTPSDHLIKKEKEYQEVVKKAKELALKGSLVTFGIKPSFTETGFGYIEADNEEVKAFHEKPDFNTATKYVEAGNYYWNSGMFCFKAGVFLEELQKYSKDIFSTCKIAFENKITNDLLFRIQHKDMINIPEDSIDYAVMEKSQKVKIVPSDIGWSDVGSFDALSNELPNDENNNLIISNRQIDTIDIYDSIIVDTDDALLVCKKGSSQKVKEVVAKLKTQNSKLISENRIGHRPWGSFSVLEDSKGYKIKKIEVKSGCRLSLQKHFHRNEHWIVLSGTATVRVGDNTFVVRPNESTYIKAGEIHRLSNEGKLPLVLLEAQVGEYTEEDDIVRIEDDYKRI